MRGSKVEYRAQAAATAGVPEPLGALEQQVQDGGWLTRNAREMRRVLWIHSMPLLFGDTRSCGQRAKGRLVDA